MGQRIDRVSGRALLAVAAAALLLIVSCAPTAAPASGSAAVDPRQTILTIAVTSEVQTFDPEVNVAAISAYRFYPNMYESLIQYAPDGSLQPMLADSWTVDPSGLAYRFKLHPGTKFSDGTPFNAAAVKFAFDRLRSVGKGAVGLFEPINAVTPVDDTTVDITLKRPYAPILQILAAWQGALFVSPTAVKQNEQAGDQGQAWLRNHTAGTGPFQLETWEPNARITAVRNPNFRNPPGPGAIQRVVLQLVSEPSTERQLVTSGDVDIVEEITPALLDPLQKTQGVTVTLDARSGDSVAIAFNDTRKPFDDQNFRRGVAYSIDYKRLVSVYQGIAVQSPGLFAQTLTPWYSQKDAMQFQLDPAKAAAEFAKSGMKVPFEPRLKYTVLWQAGQTAQRDMGTLIKEDLAKIGIDIEIQSAELPQWRDAIWKNSFQLAFIGLGPRFPDPDALASLVLSSKEFRDQGFNPGIRNPQIDDLVARGLTATNLEQRKQIYNEMQKIVTEQAYFLWLIEKKTAWVRGNDISGIVWNPNYGPFFRWDQIKKAAKR